MATPPKPPAKPAGQGSYAGSTLTPPLTTLPMVDSCNGINPCPGDGGGWQSWATQDSPGGYGA